MIGMERTLPDGFHELFGHEFADLDEVRPHCVAGGPAAPGGGHRTPEENPEFLVAEALRFLGR
jgi:hypothetical protein